LEVVTIELSWGTLKDLIGDTCLHYAGIFGSIGILVWIEQAKSWRIEVNVEGIWEVVEIVFW